MPRPRLTLFFDIVSPFAYMAFYVTRNSPVFKQCDINYIPIFLGGVMQACGNTPPIKIKNKDKYIAHDRERSAALFNIPMATKMPEGFPPNTLPVQRALCTVQAEHPEKLPEAAAALYQTFWVEGKQIGELEVVKDGLAKVFGEGKAAEIVTTITKPEVKKHLNQNTEAALERGAFGLPYFVAADAEGREDVFFGFDRLAMVVRHLGLKEEGGENGFKALL